MVEGLARVNSLPGIGLNQEQEEAGLCLCHALDLLGVPIDLELGEGRLEVGVLGNTRPGLVRGSAMELEDLEDLINL